MVVQKIIILYTFDKINPIKRKQLDRKLFGTQEKTHHGKYITTTRGILTQKDYQRPIRSAIILNENLKESVIRILREYSARILVFMIVGD